MSRFFTQRTDKTKRENYEDLCILVRENLQISHDFQILLKHGQNKTVFLPYSRRHCYEKREDCLLVATIMDKPLSNLSVVPINIQPCNQEKADTRTFSHVKEISVQGYWKVNVAIVDTDIALRTLHTFNKLDLDELWIDFGLGCYRYLIPLHKAVSL